ncbi:hypothetical protein GCM10018962_77110 [Dactylosporangium matsuzakiense]|uniref:hypothetical protein n=1 Tax=Dactylosporangium matsuzakiense TaxID=53360 RepID=UPI0031F0F396
MRLEWHGDRVARDIRAGEVEGVGRAAEWLLGESDQLVPIEEGTLARSGVASVDEATATGAVSYDTPYAVRQHEELEWQHDPGRQAKYLEQPWLEGRETMAEIIAASIRRRTGEAR